jgi:hypothetical protein
MKSRNFLSVVAFSVLGLGTVAEAAIVNIRATVVNGMYGPDSVSGVPGFSVLGTLSYDDAAAIDTDIVNTGTEAALNPSFGNVRLSFDLGVMTLTEENDADFDSFPRVTFIDGLLDDINYEVKHGVNGAVLLPYYVEGFRFLRLTPGTEPGTFDVGVEVAYGDPSEVPLPAGLPLLGGGLVLLGALRKRMRH